MVVHATLWTWRSWFESKPRSHHFPIRTLFVEGGADLFRSCQKILPCLAKARQGFLWFENFLNFPNKTGLFCLTIKFAIMETETAFFF